MVRGVSRIPDGHVLEQSVICSKDIFRPGPDLLSVLIHAPCASILQPLHALWEEV